eukprot:Pgem_evm1s17873
MFISRATTALALALTTALPNVQVSNANPSPALNCKDQVYLTTKFEYCRRDLVTVWGSDQGNFFTGTVELENPDCKE